VLAHLRKLVREQKVIYARGEYALR
jgi:hypothetical protein